LEEIFPFQPTSLPSLVPETTTPLLAHNAKQFIYENGFKPEPALASKQKEVILQFDSQLIIQNVANKSNNTCEISAWDIPEFDMLCSTCNEFIRILPDYRTNGCLINFRVTYHSRLLPVINCKRMVTVISNS